MLCAFFFFMHRAFAWLVSIRSSVNYCAKVSVEYMMGDSSTPFHIESWKPLTAPGVSSDEVVVDNVSQGQKKKKKPRFVDKGAHIEPPDVAANVTQLFRPTSSTSTNKFYRLVLDL